jgi:oxygen-independent coproporphyrinogen-3 oxidase
MTDTIALYVHWPFCLSKCPYCDFNSHVREAVDHAVWRRALLAELDHYAAALPDRRLGSIFFGGGTPSLMDPATVAAIIDAAQGHWSAEENLEITLEANPGAAERDRFAAFRDAGVQRLSLGVQSLDADALTFLGRRHSVAEARAAVATATATFARVSIDMIYARPDQTPARWRKELAQALALAGEHLSLYQLTIEPGTGFFRDGVAAAPEIPAAHMYDITQEVTARAGLVAYEVSNHAHPGGECRHNVSCWQGDDYVGIGPGAHGRLRLAGEHVATHQIHTPERWLDHVHTHGHGTAKRRVLGAIERGEEMMMTGLRLADGVDVDRICRRAGCAPAELMAAQRVEELVAGEFLAREGGHLKATATGRVRLNAVIAHLLA